MTDYEIDCELHRLTGLMVAGQATDAEIAEMRHLSADRVRRMVPRRAGAGYAPASAANDGSRDT